MPVDSSCPDRPPPPTPPTVSPTSTAVSNGDLVINVLSDPEKGEAIEQDFNANEKNILRQAGEQDMELIHLAPKTLTRTTLDVKDNSVRGKISGCLHKISAINFKPHVLSPHRSEDGRVRLVQRSKASKHISIFNSKSS